MIDGHDESSESDIEVDNVQSFQFEMRFQFRIEDLQHILEHEFSLRNLMNPRRIREKLKEYFIKATDTQLVSEFSQRTDPHFEITIIRSTDAIIGKKFFVTKDGMIGSAKNTTMKSIVIGRQTAPESQVHPNDITFTQTDHKVSRLHCALELQDQFGQFKKVPDQLYNFAPAAKNLPLNVLQKILAFIRKTPQIIIRDLMSLAGTHLKISNVKPRLIKQGDSYMIGAENKLKFILLKGNTEKNSDKIEDFDQWVNDLRAKNPHLLLRKKKDTYVDGYIPYAFVKYGVSPIIYMLLPDKGTKTVFKIGRTAENDIQISNNTISRRQCRIQFDIENSEWTILDGDIDRESSNGSWLELRNEAAEAEEPAIVKISENVLEIKMVNFDNKKRPMTLL